MRKKVLKQWYWVQIKDYNKCPICNSPLAGCHIGEYCSKKGCCYVDGMAFLTSVQAKKYKDILL